jgi:hypothetical protein
MIASAAMRFDERLALMDACRDRAVSLAKALSALPGVRVNPAVPHVNMMHLYLEADAEAVMQRRDAIAERDGVWVLGAARPAEAPGWCVVEVSVGDTLLEWGDEAVAGLVREVVC